MSGDYEEDFCQTTITLLKELCFRTEVNKDHEKCLEFSDMLRSRGMTRYMDTDVPVPTRNKDSLRKILTLRCCLDDKVHSNLLHYGGSGGIVIIRGVEMCLIHSCSWKMDSEKLLKWMTEQQQLQQRQQQEQQRQQQEFQLQLLQQMQSIQTQQHAQLQQLQTETQQKQQEFQVALIQQLVGCTKEQVATDGSSRESFSHALTKMGPEDDPEAYLTAFERLANLAQWKKDVSVSLLSVIVTFCGIVLLGVSLFVSWKLCWIPWRDKGSSQTQRKDHGHHGHLHHSHYGDLLVDRVELGPEMPERSYLDMDSYPDAGIKNSQTSPDIPVDSQAMAKESQIPYAQSHQQVANIAPATRYNTLPRPMTQQLSSPDFSGHVDEKPEQATSIGQIKPELYKQRSADAEMKKQEATSCGRISFILRYAYNTEQLVVKILKALDLPAKDANGFSDPYVKMYLLPDRKKKYQTKVHRKTLNPIFNETFHFNVPFNELQNRKLHFSIYDFDRFSRHDLIGQVVLDNLLEFSNPTEESPIWRDILEASSEKADLGEINFSLCYLPTAGRLTVTIIKASNLKAMDLTGFSDPYVKASLICEGRRLKKRKTSIKKNTLNPTYNEALVFDIPNENMDHVSLTIAVMDYDCIGHNEVIGMCRVGGDADMPGREHWSEMLANPRKPIEHWHQLVEEKALSSFLTKSPPPREKPSIVVDNTHSD